MEVVSRGLSASVRLGLAIALAIIMNGCGKTAPGVFDGSDTQVAGSALTGAVNSGDSSSSLAFFQDNPRSHPLLTALRGVLREVWIQNAWGAVCPSLATLSCSTNVMTQFLGGCNPTLDPTASWSGTVTYTFHDSTTGATACSNVAGGGLVSMGATNDFIATYGAGITRTAASSFSVALDSGSSGFSVSRSGGTQVICGATNCSASRSVNILGVHRVLFDPSGGKVYDHTISTSTPLTISGFGTAKTVAAGGVIQMQHNLARYVATTTVMQTLTFSSGCCFPTGGEIQTTFFGGGKAGSTETIDFTGTCGAVAVNGNAVTLAHCF